MAANTQPVYPGTPDVQMVQATLANTGRDGTGTLYTLFTPTVNGSRIDHIDMIATVTTAAGMLRFFLVIGANTFLIKEVPTAAATPSGTVQADNHQWIPLDGLILQSGAVLRCSTHNAETWNFIAYGGDY